MLDLVLCQLTRVVCVLIHMHLIPATGSLKYFEGTLKLYLTVYSLFRQKYEKTCQLYRYQIRETSFLACYTMTSLTGLYS